MPSKRIRNLEALNSLLGNEGKIYGDPCAEFSNVEIDSRKVGPGSLFVCLRGARDGHEFLEGAREKGAAAALTDHFCSESALPQLAVDDTRKALLEASAEWRKGFDIPVAVIAGSNGKTTTTQMLHSILRTRFSDPEMTVTEGNLNNDLGVPLMLFRLTDKSRVGVFEAGMNHIGEMAPLVSAISPTVSIMTNAQRDHAEFLDSLENTARENGEVFSRLSEDGTAVINGEDAFASLWKEMAAPRKVLTFGLNQGDFHFKKTAEGTVLQTPAGEIQVNVPLPGEHNLLNAAAAAAGAFALGFETEEIKLGLESFRPVSHRTAITRLSGGTVLIDDSYNANPDSMRAAVKMLAGQPGESKVFVMGDMKELGPNSVEWHKEIGRFAKESGISSLVCYGPLAAEAGRAFGAGAEYAGTLDEVEEKLESLLKASPKSTVLFKASNSMKLFNVVGTFIQKDGNKK